MMSLRQRPVTQEEIDACMKKLEEIFNSESKPFIEELGVEYETVGSPWPILMNALQAGGDECCAVFTQILTGTYKYKEDGSDLLWITRPVRGVMFSSN